MEETKTTIVTENTDRLEIGTPAKGGSIRVSGDFNKPDEFKAKVDKAIEVRKYANANLEVKLPSANT